ncbi:MAG: hypothetical protein FWC34_10585 [Bacteroidetes bacterium]|nr:hypothetical protein [Bacteroidota bacterium]MCL2302547.1 hypothetical protein [Lentimicrobiaceae bacterium]
MSGISKNLEKIIPHLVGVVLLRLLLDRQYEVIIYPIYASMGFLNEVSLESKIFSWVYLLVLSPLFIAFLNRTQERFLSIVMYLFFLVKFIPSTCLMAYLPMSLELWLSQALFWVIMLVLAFNLPPIRLKLNIPKYNTQLLYGITILLSGVVIYVWWVYAGARFQTSIMDVYGIRFEARNWEIPTIFTYLLPWAAVVLPLMLIWVLSNKKHIIALALIVIIYLNFSIAGHKSVIFLLFITLIIYYFFREKYLKWVLVALIGLVVLGFIEFIVFDSYYVSALAVNRVMLLPNLLDYYYFDFFSTFSPDYYHQSFLRHFGFESYYDTEIPFLIGGDYFNRPEMRSNNGLLSDAYSNFGFWGVFITPVFVIYTLKFLSNAAEGVDMKILMVPIAYICISLISSTLNAALLTGGILVLWLFLLLLPRQSIKH